MSNRLGNVLISTARYPNNVPLFDDVRDLRRHHDFPTRSPAWIFASTLARKDRQEGVRYSPDALDEMIFQQVGVEMSEVRPRRAGCPR